MGSDNAGIHLVGVASLSKLIDDEGVDPAEGYRALAVFIKDSKSTHWSKAKRAYWERFVDRDAKLRTGNPPGRTRMTSSSVSARCASEPLTCSQRCR